VWSLRPAAGFYDQPPLLAWVLFSVRTTLGSSPLALRLVPVFMGVVGTVALLPFVRDRALWALWWAAIPPLAWLTLFSTPDALLLGAWAVGLAAGIRGGWGWVLAGLAAGLASQAKYSGFALYPLLLCGAGPAVLRDRRVWLGMVLAVGVAAPNAVWVASHDAVTLRFQASEGIWSSRAPGLWGPPIQAVGQLVVVTPVAAFAGLVWAWRRAPDVLNGTCDTVDRMCWWTSVPLLLFFFLAALGGPPEAHWPAAAWIGIGVGLCRSQALARAAWTGAWFALLCSAGLAAHGVWPWMPLPNDPVHRLTEGESLGAVVGRFALPDGVAAWEAGVDDAMPVYTERYQEAALIHYYTGIEARVLPGCGRANQYDLWPSVVSESGLFVRPRTGGAPTCALAHWTSLSSPQTLGRWQIFEAE
jgi:4-amino-4-deoxy-L-arabinose transferase-like glycosyltransferase